MTLLRHLGIFTVTTTINSIILWDLITFCQDWVMLRPLCMDRSHMIDQAAFLLSKLVTIYARLDPSLSMAS